MIESPIVVKMDRNPTVDALLIMFLCVALFAYLRTMAAIRESVTRPIHVTWSGEEDEDDGGRDAQPTGE